MKRIIVKIIALLLSLFCVAAIWVYLGLWLPTKTIVDSYQWDLDFINRVPEDMRRKKVRDACHKVLFNCSWFGDGYNEFIVLEKVGNKESIPYLIRALKWQNWRQRKDIAAGKLLPCTSPIPALDALTGMEELGDDHKVWEKWWKETGRYLPFDEEKGQLVTGRDSRNNEAIKRIFGSPEQE